jgi:hypothetical protein
VVVVRLYDGVRLDLVDDTAPSPALPIYFIVTEHGPHHGKELHEAVNLFRQGQLPTTDSIEFKSLLPVGEIVRKCWWGEYATITALEADVEAPGRVLGTDLHSERSLTVINESEVQCRKQDCESFL